MNRLRRHRADLPEPPKYLALGVLVASIALLRGPGGVALAGLDDGGRQIVGKGRRLATGGDRARQHGRCLRAEASQETRRTRERVENPHRSRSWIPARMKGTIRQRLTFSVVCVTAVMLEEKAASSGGAPAIGAPNVRR